MISASSSLGQQITAAANRYGVDPALALRVASAESAGKQTAVSSKGAVGIFQLMPATAADLGVNPFDPVQNIDGGVRYLSQLQRQFGSDALALAAYNAGPGAVTQYNGIPPYAETQNYVDKILTGYGSGTPTFSAGNVLIDDMANPLGLIDADVINWVVIGGLAVVTAFVLLRD